MSAAFKAGPPLKQGSSGLAAAPVPATGAQTTIQLDKFGRRSSPDSEALTSSDDDVDLTGSELTAATVASPTSSTTTAKPAAPGTASFIPAATTPSAASVTPTPHGQPPKPARRASWLNDTSQPSVRPRNDSYASSSMSPTATHPSNPSIDATAASASAIPIATPPTTGVGSTWGPHATSPAALVNRGATAFHWGSTSSMWNTGADRKDQAQRSFDVLPSPTSAIPPGSSGSSFFGQDAFAAQPPPASASSQIPFAIPLHPTPKTYRSQSYSVGQLEPDSPFTSPAAAAGLLSTAGGASIAGPRSRPIAGLQHRPSRPSMLSEMSSEGGLGKVREVDNDGDDEDELSGLSGNNSLHSSQHSQHALSISQAQAQQQMQQPHLSAEAMKIEMLTRENALLRQQQAANQQQFHTARIRPRASTAAAYRMESVYGLQDSASTEVSDYAIDELDEINDTEFASTSSGLRPTARRMSEFAAPGSFRPPYENRKLENVKKASWQSSPTGNQSDASPSRRHSFADVPTRQASISSINDVVLAHEGSAQDAQPSAEYGYQYADPHSFASRQAAAVAAAQAGAGQPLYNNGAHVGTQHLLQQQQQQQQQRQQQQQQAQFTGGFPSPFTMQPSSFAARPASPQRGMYGMTQPNRQTPLYIVLFKCSRADVFYIQEGTGLKIKPGDLVIVEADRGTDLGTVAAEGVDWVEARRQKEHYSEEHYKWLMMYSHNAAGAQDGEGAGLMAATGLQGSTVGGMGPPGQHLPDSSTSELKPKLIKRLAQAHEIQALREKEGNEAKAKRVCMQKVKDHNLNMEILDAEFQMDWKKLTFYYFADAYINFNALVTDLFKLYKTRIWMSAINPASFASQPLGLQAPSGIGPGAVGVRNAPERRPTQSNESLQSLPSMQSIQSMQSMQSMPSMQSLQSMSSLQSMQPQFANGYPGMSPQLLTANANANASAGYAQPFAHGPYSAFGNAPRTMMGFGQGSAVPGGLPGLTGYTGTQAAGADSYGYAQNPNDYSMMRSRFANGNDNANGNINKADNASNGQVNGQNGTHGTQNTQNGSNGHGQGPDWLGAFQALSLNR